MDEAALQHRLVLPAAGRTVRGPRGGRGCDAGDLVPRRAPGCRTGGRRVVAGRRGLLPGGGVQLSGDAGACPPANLHRPAADVPRGPLRAVAPTIRRSTGRTRLSPRRATGAWPLVPQLDRHEGQGGSSAQRHGTLATGADRRLAYEMSGPGVLAGCAALTPGQSNASARPAGRPSTGVRSPSSDPAEADASPSRSPARSRTSRGAPRRGLAGTLWTKPFLAVASGAGRIGWRA